MNLVSTLSNMAIQTTFKHPIMTVTTIVIQSINGLMMEKVFNKIPNELFPLTAKYVVGYPLLFLVTSASASVMSASLGITPALSTGMTMAAVALLFEMTLKTMFRAAEFFGVVNLFLNYPFLHDYLSLFSRELQQIVIQKHPSAIQHASKHLQEDPSFILEIVKVFKYTNDASLLTHIDKNNPLFDDESIAEQFWFHNKFFKEIIHHFTEKAQIKLAIKKQADIYKFSEDIQYKAAKEDPKVLSKASVDVQIKIVEENQTLFTYANSTAQRQLITKFPKLFLLACEEIKSQKWTILLLVYNNPLITQYLDDQWLKDEKVMKIVLKESPSIFQKYSKMPNSSDFIIKEIKNNYIPPSKIAEFDDEMQLKLIEIDPNLQNYASEHIKNRLNK